MSLIDDLFVFGTANLWNTPMRVAECLANTSTVIDNVNPFDVCGNDRRDHDLYRCLEDGVYGNSIIVLDKNTFELKLALPTQGVGTWGNTCFTTDAKRQT